MATQSPGRSVLQDWVLELPFMQQTVLISAVRAPDGFRKRHSAKRLIRWYRRCILISAFDKRVITDPTEPGGGSFTGPSVGAGETWTSMVDQFLDSRDEMPLHFYSHFMHAAQIIGYKHPDLKIQEFWLNVYERMVHAFHVWPETEEQMDKRLGDYEEGWRARNDPSSTCSD